MGARSCPTPDKRAYDKISAAWRHATGLRKAGASVDVRPYKCECGRYHVGHSVSSLRFRIREARRKGTA